jgi:hypothetical protein
LSDRNPYSLRNVVSEKLQIPKAKTELFKKTFTYSAVDAIVSAQYLKNEMSDLNEIGTHMPGGERRKLIDIEDRRTKVKVTTSKNRTKI